MYNECRHIRPGGHKCRAAALKGQSFCYYHTAARRPATRRVPETGPVQLCSVEDAAGVKLAVDQVLREYGKGHIDWRSASVFFRGLQIAASLARRTPLEEKPGDSIREFFDDPTEGALAPENTACDPEDCPQCEKRRDCKITQYQEPKLDYRAIIAEFERDNPDPDD